MEEKLDVQKILEYQFFVKKIYTWIIVLVVIVELVLLRLTWPRVQDQDLWLIVVKLILASTVPISILFRAHFFVRPWLFAKYHLLKNCLNIEFKKRKQEVDFSNLERVAFSWVSPRFFGGYILHLKTGHKIRIFSVLKGSEILLERLIEYRKDLFNLKKCEHYIHRAKHVEESWKRLAESFKNWKKQLLFLLVLPLFLSLGISFLKGHEVLTNMTLNIFITTCLVSLVFGMLLNVLTEYFFILSLENQLQIQFKYIEIGAFVLHIVLWLGVSILLVTHLL